MSGLCRNHQAILKTNLPKAREIWLSSMEKGHSAHAQGNTDQAFRHFAAAAEVSAFLLTHYSQKHCPGCETSLSLTEMRVNACHNLAATAMALGNFSMAEKILYGLHQEISDLCLDKQCQRWLRLDALTSLKNTLFSLVSYLGERGQIAALRGVMRNTEEQAENAARQLLH